MTSRARSGGRGLVISLWLKGANGAVELFLGILLLVLSESFLDRIGGALTERGWGSGPQAWVSRKMGEGLAGLTGGSRTFVELYLLGHGVLKLLLAYGLLTHRKWSRPVAFILLVGFILYQSVHWLRFPSISLPFFILWDLYILVLVIRHRDPPAAGTLSSES